MKKALKTALFRHIILIVVGIALIYPVIFMIFASFKDTNEIFTSTKLLPAVWHPENYSNGWKSGATGVVTFTNFFLNTFKLVLPVVAFTVVSCTLTAYGFARFDFPFKKILFPVLISTLMLPNTVIIIPRFMLFKNLGWLDSYYPFLVPALFAVYPFFIFMIIQFLRGVPISLDESAKIDGCNTMQILTRILVPLLKPALADIFAPGEVNRIYLNFSDPWPKDRHAKRRLTSEEFMAVYDKILAEDGVVEFKTDNRGLFDYSLESIPRANWKIKEYTYDLHHSEMGEGNVMTEYEEKFSSKGNPIFKLIACR